MAHQFNAKKTQEFFDNMATDFSVATAPRDEIFLDLILPQYIEKNPGQISALDFGCGGGALLLKMTEKGINVQGIEKHDNLCQLARDRLVQAGYNQAKIIKGGVKELTDLPPESFDFVILMGVFQYLPPEDYIQSLNNIHNILKQGGHLVASFQNALFDFFTFNKYTVDFYQEKIVKPLGLDKLLGDSLIDDFKGLMTSPEKPKYSSGIARDNIYVRTSNPLTIADELKKHKFNLKQKYFYNLFFTPRLIENKYQDKLKELKKQFEIKRSTEWFGYFMANAFVVDCVKE